MSLRFQSLCSSSSGNCLALWSEKTRILVDCGLSSMKRTRRTLSHLFGDPARVDSILLTHNHTDHISYYPLRVLEEYGHTIHLHDDCVDQLKDKHFNGYGFRGLNIKPFKNRKFTVGEFSIKPFEVSHNPYYPTYGYQIYCQDKKIVIVTDFCEWDNVLEYFLDADFIASLKEFVGSFGLGQCTKAVIQSYFEHFERLVPIRFSGSHFGLAV